MAVLWIYDNNDSTHSRLHARLFDEYQSTLLCEWLCESVAVLMASVSVCDCRYNATTVAATELFVNNSVSSGKHSSDVRSYMCVCVCGV